MIRHVENFSHAGDVYPLVTVVPTREAPVFFGVRGPELRRQLRELRDGGKLICDKGRLTKQVRYPDETAKYGCVHRREYVLSGRRCEYQRPKGRMKVILW